MVSFLETRHTLRPIQKLLNFLVSDLWKAVKVDEERVGVVLQEEVWMVNVALRGEDVFIERHKQPNLFQFTHGDIGFLHGPSRNL